MSIRLLAGRFGAVSGVLADFLSSLEQQLPQAEQATPTSLEDPQRQATLYACMA